MKPLIPIRPVGAVKLRANEQNCLAWYVISGCKAADAFCAFVRPDLVASPAVLDKASKQFFSTKEAMDFIEGYREVLEGVIHPEVKPTTDLSPEQRRKRKEEAIQNLTDYVVEQAMDIQNADDKEDIIKFAEKLGLLGDGDEVPEAPRRYLPESCNACAYKKFIEENCQEDNA